VVLGYNRPFAHPTSSFNTPVQAPSSDPDEGVLVQATFNAEWLPYVLGALYQLTLQTTWKGTPEEILEAQYRAIILMHLFGVGEPSEVETPFWDDETDVDDNAPTDDQPWYGQVTNPTAPAGELDFVESVALWIFTGLVAVATFEVAGIAPAIAFHTTVEKFIILQKRGDVAETIRFVVDGQDAKFVNTAPYAPGEIIETPIITPQTGGGHDILIIGGSS
jgi:hypothetical protein